MVLPTNTKYMAFFLGSQVVTLLIKTYIPQSTLFEVYGHISVSGNAVEVKLCHPPKNPLILAILHKNNNSLYNSKLRFSDEWKSVDTDISI